MNVGTRTDRSELDPAVHAMLSRWRRPATGRDADAKPTALLSSMVVPDHAPAAPEQSWAQLPRALTVTQNKPLERQLFLCLVHATMGVRPLPKHAAAQSPTVAWTFEQDMLAADG